MGALKTCALSPDNHIQNEKKVLNELGQNRGPGSPNEFLSILEKELELDLKLGSYQKKVPALLLSPRGIPLLSRLSSQGQKAKLLKYATSVRNDVTEALEHVHKKRYLHNDISPKNMIVILPQGEDQRIKICLVDFGCASAIDYGIKYPIGTPAFMHKELLNMDKYRSKNGLRRKKSHDFFGLDLSCAAILHLENPGHPSWDMTGYKKKDNLETVLLDRRDNATAILDTY